MKVLFGNATVFLSFLFAIARLSHASREPQRILLSELSGDRISQSAVPLPDANLSQAPVDGTVLVKFVNRRHVAAVRVTKGEAALATQVLANRPDVEFAEPDRLMQRQAASDDPLLAQQWHHAQIGSTDAWDYAPGNASVRIAIVDYVFQMNHPDLAANTDTGWDVVNETRVFASQVPGTYPYDDHATISAGMAAAVTGNGTGVAGAGNCRLVPVRINGLISEMYQATVWAASNGVRVVNLSWDGADSSTLNEAGRILREEIDGILVMAGVNGRGRLDYTNHPYIVGVSMTDANDALQSRHGPHIDFAAPGAHVTSTTTVGGYGADSGTSYAAPLVSGVLAALLSMDASVTAEDALMALSRSAMDLGAAGWDEHFGWGRVDFGDASWLTALTADLSPTLSIQGVKAGESWCALDVDLRRGLRYTLQALAGGPTSEWRTVTAAVVTTGTMARITVPLKRTATHYRVTGAFP